MKCNHVLQVIIEGLDNGLQCIEPRKGQKLVKVFPDFFNYANAPDIKKYQAVQYLAIFGSSERAKKLLEIKSQQLQITFCEALWSLHCVCVFG